MGAATKIENATLTVKELGERPSDVPAPTLSTHGYINFETEKMSDEDISSVTIKFKVSKIWMNQNNIDSKTIKLNKHAAGG